jgi:AraC-like DNA-binding protein
MQRVTAPSGLSPVIAAWVTDAVARERLATAVSERLPRRTRGPVILWCDSADELVAAVARHDTRAAIIEIGGSESGDDTTGAAGGISRLEEVTRTLRAEYPSVPVLIYAPLTAAASRTIVALARAGITNVIIAGHDDLNHAVRPILDASASACAAEVAFARLSAVASPGVAVILGYALRYGTTAPTVAAAARALRVHRKTLAAWCLASGAPSPRVLITWCRLVIAAERLAEARWPTERVARAFGFGSGSALAGLIRRHLGLTRAQLREGGSGIVIEMLVRRLIDGRRRSETGDRGQGGAGSAAS